MNAKNIWAGQGMAQEMNNCLQEAKEFRAELNSKDAARIAEALAAGKFVLVHCHAYYCRSTDAYAGEVRSFVGYSDTRELAREAMAAFAGAENQDDDSHFEILPLEVVKHYEAPASDCPF